jgi:glycosyltransferase involved in cell wall biosynthesis
VKVLVIAPQPFFSPRGTPLSVYYRTLVTAELGHQVDLLTYGQGVDPDIPGVRIVRIPAFRWLGEVKVGPSLLKAFFDVWIFWYAVAMMVRHRYDVVHAHEEAVFFCRFLQPIFRYKLVYDLHSILSQQLTNFDFTRSRLLIGMFARLEDGCLARADAVISISPALAGYAVSRVRDPAAHFLIENSLFDPVRFAAPPGDDGERSEAEPEWLSLLSGDRPVVLYAGTFESYQGIDVLLEAFARASQQWPREASQVRAPAPPVLLLLGGRPEQVEAARRHADELGIGDDCHFGGTVSRALAQRATREANVLTSPRTVGDNTPLKIYEQIASGVPLVATRIGSHTQVLSEDDCVLADPDPRSLAEGLIIALRGGADITRRVANARALYEASYSPEAYRDKMKRLFDRLRGNDD